MGKRPPERDDSVVVGGDDVAGALLLGCGVVVMTGVDVTGGGAGNRRATSVGSAGLGVAEREDVGDAVVVVGGVDDELRVVVLLEVVAAGGELTG